MRSIKRGVALVLMGVVLGLFPFLNVCAFGNPTITISGVQQGTPDIRSIENTVTKINNKLLSDDLMENALLTYSYSAPDKTIVIEMNKSDYSELDQEDKQFVMDITLNSIQDSDISAINRTKLYNFVSEADPSIASLVRQLSSDVTADYARAYASFKPFTTPLSWFLGILAISIFVMLGFTILLDITYLVIPLSHIVLFKSNSGEKPHLISLEAWSAMKEAESKVGTGSSSTPLSLWFLMRAKSFIVLGVCFLYLISGKIYSLLANLVDYFSNLLPS